MAESDSDRAHDAAPETEPGAATNADPAGRPVTTGVLVRDVALYTLARLAMVAIIGGVLLALHVPLLVAFAVGVIVAMPLSLLVLKKLRTRVSTEIAEVNTQRQTERDKLRAELRGE